MSPFLGLNRGWVVYLLTSNTNPAFVSTLNELPLVVTPNAASASLANNSPARLADKVGDFIANGGMFAQAQCECKG